MELRPRCTTCRKAGHTVCPPAPAPVVQRRSRVIRNRAPVVAQPKCCSFCSRPGHYKPRCEKYKVFVEEVKPHDASNFMIVVVDRLIKDMQNMFSRFMKSQFNNHQMLQIFEMSEEGFRHFVQVFLQAFDEHMVPAAASAPAPASASAPAHAVPKIAVELHETTSKVRNECGICLVSNIPCSKMVKLGCGHEFCGGCAEKFINVKPCCAFCRADVKKVTVASKSMLSKFKKNKKFAGV